MERFECRLVFEREGKKTSECYLVDGVNHGDAESKCIEEVKDFIEGDFIVDKVQRKRFSEVLMGESECFYTSRVSLITLDEKTGAEKRKNVTLLVNADTIADALSKTADVMNGLEFDIEGVNKSPILEYFRCESVKENAQ